MNHTTRGIRCASEWLKNGTLARKTRRHHHFPMAQIPEHLFLLKRMEADAAVLRAILTSPAFEHERREQVVADAMLAAKLMRETLFKIVNGRSRQ